MTTPTAQMPLEHLELDLPEMVFQAGQTAWRVHAMLELFAAAMSLEEQGPWKFALEGAAMLLKPACEQMGEVWFQLHDPSKAEEGQAEEVGS